jgi:outer membrane protein assembly factor BamD
MSRFIVIIVSCLLLFSCASKPVKKSENPGDLYVQGVNMMKAKKYSEAIEKFSEVRENFPFDPMALIATVKLGDVYFDKKDYGLALSVYEDFFKAHPEDENIPYVLLRIGDCYDKLALTMDRDQAYSLKAIERYTYLKNRYPSSDYTATAEANLKKLNQKLADRELYVGEFYYRTYQYNAAIVRLDYLLKKYPHVNGLDKALYYIAMSYKALGDPVKSDEYIEKLQGEYPKSTLNKPIKRERQTLQSQKKIEPPPVRQDSTKRRDIDLRPKIVMASSTEGEAIGATPEKQQRRQAEKSKEKDKGGLGFIDKNKPIDIVSDTMEGFDKEKMVVFKGSVIAKQDDLYIFTDQIETYMNEESNEISKAYAKGSVKIVKQDRTAAAKEAFFDNTKGEIILKGDVVVFQGQDKVTGNVVTYYINEDKVVVEGEPEKRARAVLTPRSKTSEK